MGASGSGAWSGVSTKRSRLRADTLTAVLRERGVAHLVGGEGDKVWLVEARLLGTALEPWMPLTDWPVTDVQSAVRIFSMYRQRWAVEDSFRFLKDILG